MNMYYCQVILDGVNLSLTISKILLKWQNIANIVLIQELTRELRFQLRQRVWEQVQLQLRAKNSLMWVRFFILSFAVKVRYIVLIVVNVCVKQARNRQRLISTFQ